LRPGLVVVLSLVLLTAPSAAAARPHVTLITDSVGGALLWDAPAARIFSQGLDVDLELKACRRLTTLSCPAGGEIPENVLQLIRERGRSIGPNVVIAVGYNDFPQVYASGIELTLRALTSAGVEHVFWLTLRAARHPYLESNAAIFAAARRHPQVTVIDWNTYARGHSDWFQPDGLHPTGAGAEALARFMHDRVLEVLRAPPPIDVSLDFPRAAVTAAFTAHLHARGGKAPYRFVVSGLPHGLRARANGTITGSPPTGAWTLHVRVQDARGIGVTTSVGLDVSRWQSVVSRSH
jgi:lysophospholipase L1-like esterase